MAPQLKENILRRALFLDRDGVINVDYGYVHHSKDFVFIDGIFDLCRYAAAQNYLIIVITNQAGIGRGYYTEDEFESLSDWMVGRFEEENASIDAIYHAPYYQGSLHERYRRGSYLRKPNPGMIFNAARIHSLDLQKSLLIGDKITDVRAGQDAGIGKNFLFGGSSVGRKFGKIIEIDSLDEIRAHLTD